MIRSEFTNYIQLPSIFGFMLSPPPAGNPSCWQSPLNSGTGSVPSPKSWMSSESPSSYVSLLSNNTWLETWMGRGGEEKSLSHLLVANWDPLYHKLLENRQGDIRVGAAVWNCMRKAWKNWKQPRGGSPVWSGHRSTRYLRTGRGSSACYAGRGAEEEEGLCLQPSAA